MTARPAATRFAARSRRRRPSHLALVQTLPTRPPLHRRLLRMLPARAIAIACGLALLAVATIYVMRPSAPQRTVQAAAQSQRAPYDAANDGRSAERAQALASTQPHVLMARVY